ncbi:MAG: hypothetical protein AAGA86_04460 [Bacteroidota bacterium]
MGNSMLKQVHLAAQYLATVGKRFLPAKNDDSHTSLGFVPKNGALKTWPLNDSGHSLVFDYSQFALRWNSEANDTLALDGKTHGEIVSWITEVTQVHGLSPDYDYELHYKLPYPINNDFQFSLDKPTDLREQLRLRNLAQVVLESFLRQGNLRSDIRVWPHHFDTGAFVSLNDGSQKSIGLGMAIPDKVCNDHYFYISGYQGSKPMEVSTFKGLPLGQWKNTDFKGALLPTTGIDIKNGVLFFQEASKAYRNV